MSGEEETSITNFEATLYLIACRPLVHRLVTEGLDLALDEYDRADLDNFKRVWLAGLLENDELRRAANLSHSDIGLLIYALNRQITERLRALHAAGEPL